MTRRRARWTLAVAALLTVLSAILAAGVLDRLSLNRFEAPGAESMRARAALAGQFGTGSPNLTLLVTATAGTVDSPAVVAAGQALTEELAGRPGVADVWSYWSTGNLGTLRSDDARQALVLAWLPGDADHVRRDVLPTLTPAFTRADGTITVQVGGGDEVFRTVMQQARADFLRAELIVLPLVFVLLCVVFRRPAAAAVTLGAGIFAVLGSLALLRGVVEFVEISTFASNIALVMGIGLGVDYGLFMIFRFGEELRAGATVTEAVRRSRRFAGRTVIFSAATVAASLAVLLLFPFPFLASFAYAGIAVVLAAALAATVFLPAALTLLGRRAQPAARGDGTFWHGLAVRVMKKPIRYGGSALAVLLLLGAPLLGIRFGLPDDRVLPASAPVRQMYDDIRAGFPQEEADALQIVAAPMADLDSYAAALSRLTGVVRVDSAAGSFTAGAPVPGIDPARFTGSGGTWLSVVPSSAALETDATALVAAVRAVPAPAPVDVGGYPADLADYRAGVLDRLPLIGAAILIVTFIVLFLMTGSVVAPLKAAALNLLSLSVMFGALVFVFQQGNFAGLLGFTPTGSIEPSIPILMFCVAWGLSMDYEVFLLARIKEEYDRTGDPYAAVPAGIARSAPLVTAAAVILAASFAAYATGRVVFLQQLGIGMALAVLVDATLVRGVLMPAFLRLAGDANWWAPAPLRRLQQRLGRIEPPLPAEPVRAPG